MNNTTNTMKQAHDLRYVVMVLKIGYIITFGMIILTNSVVIWRISRKKNKSRANIMFLFLSISDISVGLITIPIVAWGLLQVPLNPGCALPCELLIYFNYFPYSYSWILTIVIALDRSLLVIKQIIYENLITKKCLIWISLALLIGVILINIALLKVSLYVRSITKVGIEITFILITLASYLYLINFVRKSSRSIQDSIHNKSNYGKEVTKTVAYIFLCQMLLTLPQFAYFFILMPFALTSKLVSSFSAQLIYHAVLILRYTNSYTNALILLVRQRKTKPSIEIKEKVRIRAFTTFSSNAIIMYNYNSNETFNHTFSSK